MGKLFLLIVQVTIEGLRALYLLGMAIFSPVYRARLAEQWDCSGWSRAWMLMGGVFYGSMALIAVTFWLPRVMPDGKVERTKSETIRLTSSEVRELRKTKEFDELAEVGGRIFKRKLAERLEKEKARREGEGAEPDREQ